jgi:hypothetical protein
MLHLKLSVHAKSGILKALSYILSLNLVCTYILFYDRKSQELKHLEQYNLAQMQTEYNVVYVTAKFSRQSIRHFICSTLVLPVDFSTPAQRFLTCVSRTPRVGDAYSGGPRLFRLGN